MDDAKIAGAPSGHVPPEPAAEAPTAPPAPVEARPPQPAAPTPPRPQPVAVEAKAEPVTPEPAAEVSAAEEISSRLREELEAARQAREALEAREARAVSRERIDYLRKMGALGSLSDEHLLALAPDADPGTQAGREELHAWTEGNGGLFVQRSPTGVELQQSVLERLPSSREGVFGAKLHKAVIDSVFGSGSKR